MRHHHPRSSPLSSQILSLVSMSPSVVSRDPPTSNRSRNINCLRLPPQPSLPSSPLSPDLITVRSRRRSHRLHRRRPCREPQPPLRPSTLPAWDKREGVLFSFRNQPEPDSVQRHLTDRATESTRQALSRPSLTESTELTQEICSRAHFCPICIWFSSFSR